MRRIKIKRSQNCLMNNIFKDNGYKEIDLHELESYNQIREYLPTGCKNTRFAFEKEDLFFIFDGWEQNKYQQTEHNAKFIYALDITEIIKNFIIKDCDVTVNEQSA